MTSLRLSLVAAALAIVAGTATAQPQSNAARADALNNDGKAAMQDSNFAAASDKFNQAILLSPEGRFYFNLCVALYSQGKLSDALAACKAVEAAGADASLRDKTSKMTNKIKDEIRKLGFDPDAPTTTEPTNPTTDPTNPTTDPTHPTTDPTNPTTDPTHPTTDPANPNPGVQPAIVAPPPISVIKGGAPEHQYTWTLGFELLGGGGKIGVKDEYSSSVYGFRFLGDYLISPARQIGAQATIGVFHADSTDEAYGIDIVDIGLDGYKHLCKGRLCVTPLVGVSLGLMQPEEIESDDALLAVGVRAEARLGYAFGNRFEHLVSLSLGLQAYTKAFDSSTFDAEELGLDEASALAVVALGYTYRFNTPFGSSPFVTLE